jgi:hypothetical protein
MHCASFAIITALIDFSHLQAADHKSFGGVAKRAAGGTIRKRKALDPHSFKVINAVVMKSIEELDQQK